MGAGRPADAARIVVETSQLRCSENGYECEGLLLAHYPWPGPDCIRPVFGSVAADLSRTAVSSPVPAPVLRRYSEK